MYYYIFQSPKNSSEQKIHEKIRQLTTLLGISGESSIVSPARTATELTVIGLEKGYSTIVAVGSEELVNEVASTVSQTEAVLGIIPINSNEKLNEIIGTDDFKFACEALQKRNIASVNMGYLDPGINFLTNLNINSDKALSVQAEIDGFYISTKANAINIDNNLTVKLFIKKEEKGLLGNLFNFFKNTEKEKYDSIFFANKLKMRTNEIISVKIGNLIVAKTPIIAYRKPEALKIIKFHSKIK